MADELVRDQDRLESGTLNRVWIVSTVCRYWRVNWSWDQACLLSSALERVGIVPSARRHAAEVLLDARSVADAEDRVRASVAALLAPSSTLEGYQALNLEKGDRHPSGSL